MLPSGAPEIHENDTDDESGFHTFAQRDQESREHGGSSIPFPAGLRLGKPAGCQLQLIRN
jgi:hypothetical protein